MAIDRFSTVCVYLLHPRWSKDRHLSVGWSFCVFLKPICGGIAVIFIARELTALLSSGLFLFD